MELEKKYGFRSAFNLIPEREYRVSDSLRRRIDESGFEVGIHGLKHDGKLYSSKTKFASRAARIREYAQKWNASGFRSPLMQHKLAWLHLLGTEYDASTFDTDPFEPEADGAGTIFPFWVPGPSGGGYVELPYTLAQDHSLFIVLRETNIDIWKRKLDWVASRGGMALVNTHPDYMCFDGAKARDEYPVSLYEEFLDYARSKYEGRFWHSLPRDISRFCTTTVAAGSRNSGKKICMLAYSNYDNDSRIRRYAETLVRRGDRVDVIAISSRASSLNEEKIGGVTVLRIQHRDKNERGKWAYAWRLLRFLLVSSRLLARRHREIRYDLIHIHNMPDFLVYAAWYPKLMGVPVILDIHDLVPELFANKFGAVQEGFSVKCLQKMEKACAGFADHVIIANHIWEEKLLSRSVPRQKLSVFLNHIDSTIFYRRNRTRTDKRFIIIFPGTWQWHQGLDIAIEAVALLKDRLPEAELHLYGGGGGADAQDRLASLANRLSLNGRVKFCGDLSLNEIANVMANADIGIVPKRADSFGNEAYSTKIMEYMSQGLPVVASRTRIDTFYFDDKMIRFFPSGDSRAMADAILEVKEDLALRNSLVRNGLEYATANDWDHRKQAYLDLVDSLATETFT
jgi:glycosyltransferase involved in cell wall biosynthesis/peptidoglycan/xylan/chitin deacetylase (PgdA/CDA1 family)